MRLTLAAIGKAKASSPEMQLYAEYVKRLPWKLALKEFEPKKNLPGDARKTQEGELLLAACEGAHKIIVLDERGKSLSSREFSGVVSGWQQQGASHIACIIGGADGLSDAVRARADLLLSFGRLSWPHMLVRALLAEQLYRAWSILEGHPYHRD